MAQRGWHFAALAVAASVFASRAAHACSVIEKPGSPQIGTLAYVRSLIPDAQLVVRARALRYGEGQHYLVPPDATGLGEARAIEFEVLEVLRPDVGREPPRRLYIGGHLTDSDDFNPGPVPYVHVRREGQRGSCSASAYRTGGEFLLLLRRTKSGYYTPYWAILAPVNEQVRGADDPWVHWISHQLSAAPVPGISKRSPAT